MEIEYIKKNYLKLLFGLFMFLTVYFGVQVYTEAKEVKEDFKLVEQSREIFFEERTINNNLSQTQKEKKKEEENSKNIKLLKEQINPDIVGWIHIPNTNINEPFVQSEVPLMYLRKDLSGQYNPLGTIFLDTGNSLKEDVVSYLFGHNTYNGKKFADLNLYKNEKFLQEHKNIFLYTEDGVYQYKVIGSSWVEPVTAIYPEKKFEVLDESLKNILIETGVDNEEVELLKEVDKLLVLVTCKDSSDGTLRRVVIAKRV